jgi:hypothetical protein
VVVLYGIAGREQTLNPPYFVLCLTMDFIVALTSPSEATELVKGVVKKYGGKSTHPSVHFLPGGGLTLDFFLALTSPSEVTELVEELSDICSSLKMSCSIRSYFVQSTHIGRKNNRIVSRDSRDILWKVSCHLLKLLYSVIVKIPFKHKQPQQEKIFGTISLKYYVGTGRKSSKFIMRNYWF